MRAGLVLKALIVVLLVVVVAQLVALNEATRLERAVLSDICAAQPTPQPGVLFQPRC